MSKATRFTGMAHAWADDQWRHIESLVDEINSQSLPDEISSCRIVLLIENWEAHYDGEESPFVRSVVDQLEKGSVLDDIVELSGDAFAVRGLRIAEGRAGILAILTAEFSESSARQNQKRRKINDSSWHDHHIPGGLLLRFIRFHNG